MLADLIKDLKSAQDAKPQRQLELLITSWYEEEGTQEDKQAIYDFAKEHQLLFMIPAEWFEDELLEKASKEDEPEKEDDSEKQDENQDENPDKPEENKEEVDHSTIVFNIQADATTADAIRKFVKFLTNSSKKSDTPAIVKFMSGDEDLPDSIKLQGDKINVKHVEEDYLREEDLAKALLIEVRDASSLEAIQNILDAARNSENVRVDEDSLEIVETNLIPSELRFETRDNSLLIEAGEDALAQLENLFTVIADHGNGGHSFSIEGDEKNASWDGDGSDYITKVDLLKATTINSPLQYAIQSYRTAAVLNEQYAQSRAIIINLQEELAPYGVMVGTDNLGGIILTFQEGFVRDIVRDKLEDMGLTPYIAEVAQENIKCMDIIFVYINLAEQVDPAINKARKGTPGYEKWLESYRAKRTKKQKALEESKDQNGNLQQELSQMSLEDQIKKLLEVRTKERSLLDDVSYQLKRMENERKLEDSITRFTRKN